MKIYRQVDEEISIVSSTVSQCIFVLRAQASWHLCDDFFTTIVFDHVTFVEIEFTIAATDGIRYGETGDGTT